MTTSCYKTNNYESELQKLFCITITFLSKTSKNRRDFTDEVAIYVDQCHKNPNSFHSNFEFHNQGRCVCGSLLWPWGNFSETPAVGSPLHVLPLLGHSCIRSLTASGPFPIRFPLPWLNHLCVGNTQVTYKHTCLDTDSLVPAGVVKPVMPTLWRQKQ